MQYTAPAVVIKILKPCVLDMVFSILYIHIGLKIFEINVF